ncbi:hypothetical protein DN440_01145 [Lactobacillus reuteri]|nr:hypothetical protein [Limosilactobacillus reuteri]
MSPHHLSFLIYVAVEALDSQEASASLGSAYFLTSIKISNKINRVKFNEFMGITSSQFTWEVIPIFYCLADPK